MRHILWLSAVAACTPKGAHPHDMSEAAHEAQAEQHDASAAAAESQYNPSLTTTQTRCHPTKGGRQCWTSTTNPTDEWLRLAEQERKAAEAHRAASTALVAAENEACAGLDPEERDISPFEHTADIVSVTPHGGPVPDGATVVFALVPDLSREWLQQAVDWHLARAAALGHEMPEMPNCPLVPKGAKARVDETAAGLAVTVTSDDPRTAADIVARAQHLVAP